MDSEGNSTGWSDTALRFLLDPRTGTGDVTGNGVSKWREQLIDFSVKESIACTIYAAAALPPRCRRAAAALPMQHGLLGTRLAGHASLHHIAENARLVCRCRERLTGRAGR